MITICIPMKGNCTAAISNDIAYVAISTTKIIISICKILIFLIAIMKNNYLSVPFLR